MHRNLKKVAVSAVAVAAVFASMIPAASATSTPASSFNVTVNLTSKCEITSAPTDVAFTYTSFQAAASTSTGGAFQVRCTNNLPYTMALDATSGTVIGLNYALALSAAGGTGTGLTAISHTVNGTMAASQSGDCTVGSCSGTSVRTLTVSY